MGKIVKYENRWVKRSENWSRDTPRDYKNPYDSVTHSKRRRAVRQVRSARRVQSRQQSERLNQGALLFENPEVYKRCVWSSVVEPRDIVSCHVEEGRTGWDRLWLHRGHKACRQSAGAVAVGKRHADHKRGGLRLPALLLYELPQPVNLLHLLHRRLLDWRLMRSCWSWPNWALCCDGCRWADWRRFWLAFHLRGTRAPTLQRANRNPRINSAGSDRFSKRFHSIHCINCRNCGGGCVRVGRARPVSRASWEWSALVDHVQGDSSCTRRDSRSRIGHIAVCVWWLCCLCWEGSSVGEKAACEKSQQQTWQVRGIHFCWGRWRIANREDHFLHTGRSNTYSFSKSTVYGMHSGKWKWI